MIAIITNKTQNSHRTHILYLIKHTRLSTTQQQAMPSMFQHARGSTNPSTLFTCAFKKQTKEDSQAQRKSEVT